MYEVYNNNNEFVRFFQKFIIFFIKQNLNGLNKIETSIKYKFK